jgi:molybdate transport system regulatory protein
MNRLFGTVTALESEGDISLVEIDVQGDRLTSLVVESGASAAYLAPGLPVTVRFKESEVSIAVGGAPAVSIRNRLTCSIREITAGRILSHLILDYYGATLHSLISTKALKDLDLQIGMNVYALIKATEVSLGEGHVRI